MLQSLSFSDGMLEFTFVTILLYCLRIAHFPIRPQTLPGKPLNTFAFQLHLQNTNLENTAHCTKLIQHLHDF